MKYKYISDTVEFNTMSLIKSVEMAQELLSTLRRKGDVQRSQILIF